MNMCSVSTFALESSQHGGNQLRAGGALIDKIQDWLRTLDIALPPKADFLATVGMAYDQYVAPIDIPGVPNVVEPWVDASLKAIVLKQASSLYDKFSD